MADAQKFGTGYLSTPLSAPLYSSRQGLGVLHLPWGSTAVSSVGSWSRVFSKHHRELTSWCYVPMNHNSQWREPVFYHVGLVQLINPGQVYSGGRWGFISSELILIIHCLPCDHACLLVDKSVLLSIWVELLANTYCPSSLGSFTFSAAPLTTMTCEALERKLGSWS